MRIVLASTSRYRRELVSRLPLAIESMAPPYDEDVDKARFAHLPVPELVTLLAKGKAASLAALHPDALVIGSDQMGELDGRRLGKPHTVEAACAQLEGMAGRVHRLHTALVVHHGASGCVEHVVDTHELAMRALTADEIARYVALDNPVDCAGSYRVESLGVALFERITGDDFTAVVGLPLTKLVTLLARFGVRPLA